MENKSIPKIKMLVAIVNKGKGKRVIRILQEMQTNCQFASLGFGTADQALHDYLGLSETSKDIVFGLISEESVLPLLNTLTEELDINKQNSGIAFTIPLDSVSNLKTLQYIMGEKKEI